MLLKPDEAIPGLIFPGGGQPEVAEEGADSTDWYTRDETGEFIMPFERWAVAVLSRGAERRRVGRKIGYCIACGWFDVLPDGFRDQYCVEYPLPPRNDGLPRYFTDGPCKP